MTLNEAINAYLANPEYQYINNDRFGKKIIVDRNTLRIFDFNGNYFDMTTEMLLDSNWVCCLA